MLDRQIFKKIKINKFKYLIYIFIIISLFFLIKFSKSKNNTSQIPEIEESVSRVLVKKINSEKFQKSIILRGYTKSSREVVIRSQVEGKISVINYLKGANVNAGDQIVLIDPEDKIAKQKEMEALLEQRKKEYQVAEKLFKNGFRSEVKLSESRTKFESALALFEKSQVDLNNTKVIIPFDSFLEDSYVELGDYLKKGDKIVKVVDLDPIFLIATANETEVINLSLNQVGIASFKNGTQINGKINYISSSADEETRNFKVQLELKNKENKIRSGLSGEMQIFLKAQNAFFIPSSVITLNEKGDLGVKIVTNKIISFFPIEIINDNGKGYWIKNNNKEELILVTRGQEFVVDGESVDIEFQE